MTRDEFNAFCATLPQSNHVVQWGGADVWKVGGKVFALCGWNHGKDGIAFKVSEMAFHVLSTQAGLRPAPYFAARGMTWIQHFEAPGLSDAELRKHIRASHDMVSSSLAAKLRGNLGL